MQTIQLALQDLIVMDVTPPIVLRGLVPQSSQLFAFVTLTLDYYYYALKDLLNRQKGELKKE